MQDDHALVDLYQALLSLENEQQARNFIKDLCTPQEIASLQERWRVCQMLDKGTMSYRQIHARIGASLTTIGRVARFLKDEPHHGYRQVLNHFKK